MKKLKKFNEHRSYWSPTDKREKILKVAEEALIQKKAKNGN